jgi:hydrogenase/urease accessory protein HupE
MLWRTLFLSLVVVALGRSASAHPVPFSYLDLTLRADRLDGTLVAHVIDVAHDLSIDPADRLLDGPLVDTLTPRLYALFESRMTIAVDGRSIAPSWAGVQILADRQALRLRFTAPLRTAPGLMTVRVSLFPYDPIHQTFLNIYEADRLVHQGILDHAHPGFDYYAGSAQGVVAVVRRFAPAGIHHILIGPDHILFLIGLLLLGGSLRQLLFIVTAFTIAHSVTLSLAALAIVSPPSRVIEPAIALSIVYIGADNLLVKDGRDMRPWIALAFGFIHGFGFASVLRQMNLPTRALGWSLFSFNLGVEIGQVLIVAIVASLLGALRARNAALGRRIVFAGSIVVMSAGAFWFIQRVFFVSS